MTALGKDQIAHPSAKAHSKEEPSIECHHYQHENVAITDLNDMEATLKNVHRQTEAVEAETATDNVLNVCMNHRCDVSR